MSGDPFSIPIMTILQNVNIWAKYAPLTPTFTPTLTLRLGGSEGGGEAWVEGIRFIQNVHIYKNGHNWGRKWVSRHDSGAIRREI